MFEKKDTGCQPPGTNKKLIDCQAETIITTNYDHLIEQAAEL
jgi:hypothetical protein